MKNKLHGLYGITSQDMLLDNAVLMHHVEQALQGGMNILQYRNKQQPCLQSVTHLKSLKQLCHAYNALFIINDNVELCSEIKADGVHLGRNDSDIALAREVLGSNAIIGVSCYNDLSLAQKAHKEGASYIAFGAFYASPTKPQAATADITLIQQAQSLHLPICCIGGISSQTAPALIKQGADMIAVISELFNSHDIQSNAENFKNLF